MDLDGAFVKETGVMEAPTTEAGRALVNEPEWSDKEHRRAIALAIEAEARAAGVWFESREALTAALYQAILDVSPNMDDEPYAAAIVAAMLDKGINK